ncbi:MAG: hypothetical protein M3037_09545 [Gemmatimonadota bacterium]|nr:hypothetical protein [Gemmatimonadota bacterium]
MNSRSFWVLTFGAALIAACAAKAGAQSKNKEETVPGSVAANSVGSSPERVADSARTYNAGALRFETSWGNVSIIRGADGPVIGSLGWFRDYDLTQLLAASPPAVADARVFQTNNSRGSIVWTIGATTTLIGILVAANSSNNASSPALIIGGVGAMTWGAQHLSRSYSALSRALWFYNRDLKR